MKTRKIIAVALAVIMILALAVSCGNNNNNDGGTSGTSTPTPTKAADTSGDDAGDDAADTGSEGTDTGLKHYGDVVLDFLSCWNSSSISVPEDMYNNEVATIIREKIGVTIMYDGIMMNETEKLNLMFASGDMPHIVNAPYWIGGGETKVIQKAATEGQLHAIDDVLEVYPEIARSWEVGIISQPTLEVNVEPPIFQGKHYVVPTQTPGSEKNITHWAYGVFVRGDILEALGYQPSDIKTTYDIVDLMYEIRDGGFKDVNGNDIVTFSTFHDGWDHGQIFISLDNKYYTGLRQDENGKFTTSNFTDAYTERVKIMRNLVADGIMDVEAFRCTDAQAKEKFGNGSAAVGASQYGNYIDTLKESGLYWDNPEMRYVALGPLQYKNGDTWTVNESFGRNGTPCLIFPITNPNVEASIAFTLYANTMEGILLMDWGFEGDTYYFDDTGSPRWMDDIKARKAEGEPTIAIELRNRGIYGLGSFLYADMRKDWWTDDPELAVPELDEFKANNRPIVRYQGYPITALEYEFPEIETYRMVTVDERSYRERAYFAATEAEALAIVEEYRNAVLTAEGGVVTRLWAWYDELYPTRDDFVY